MVAGAVGRTAAAVRGGNPNRGGVLVPANHNMHQVREMRLPKQAASVIAPPEPTLIHPRTRAKAAGMSHEIVADFTLILVKNMRIVDIIWTGNRHA